MNQKTDKKINDCLDHIIYKRDSQKESREQIEKYIGELKEYIKHKKEEETKNLLSKILDLEIKNHIKESRPSNVYLAHYTSLKTIFSILNEYKNNEENKQDSKNDINSGLRAYDAFSVNDPTEGRYLRKYLEKDYKWLVEARQSTEAFVCSFVSGDADIGDNLKFWQAYGKDGLGCSIQLSRNFDNRAFDRVLYGENEMQTIKGRFKNYFKLGNLLYENYPKKGGMRKRFAADFLKMFDRLNFLCKSSSYSNEKEYRCIITQTQEKDIKYHFKDEGPYLRRYVLSEKSAVNKILASGGKVIVGPRVKDKERLCRNLKSLAKSKKIYGPEFIPSKIPYQKIW